jgi:hypothetical protein
LATMIEGVYRLADTFMCQLFNFIQQKSPASVSGEMNADRYEIQWANLIIHSLGSIKKCATRNASSASSNAFSVGALTV